MKRCGRKEKNKGFTLVELIVSIVMLAIITIPLLSYFTSAAAYNARAKTTQEAVALSQSIIEKCKDKSIENIARSFHAGNTEFMSNFNLVPLASIDSDRSRVLEVNSAGSALAGDGSYDISTGVFHNSANGLLYYEIKNIQGDGNEYDALLTVDTNITAGTAYYDTNVNTTLYQIKAIQSPQNIIAAETTQNARAVVSISDLNRSYCDQQNAAHAGESSWTYKVPVNETVIQGALCRDIYVKLEPYETASSVISTTQAKVKVYYKYYCPGIEGGPQNSSSAVEVDPPLYQETVSLADMKNIYVFFQRNLGVEQINLDIDAGLSAYLVKKINFYLLCQAVDAAENTVPVFDASFNPAGNSFLYVDKVLSNAHKVSKNNDGSNIMEGSGYISREADLRMINIKVDIYKAGKLLNPDFLYASITSAKGE